MVNYALTRWSSGNTPYILLGSWGSSGNGFYIYSASENPTKPLVHTSTEYCDTNDSNFGKGGIEIPKMVLYMVYEKT